MATEEVDPRFADLDGWSLTSAMEAMWEGQLAAVAAVGHALPAITAATELAKDALRDSPRQSLNDRIEEARNNTLVPRSVLEVIDKNQTGLKGHSAAKYTELVDILLAVPWGKLSPIDVGPKEFATGLDTSHYGLVGPKASRHRSSRPKRQNPLVFPGRVPGDR